MGLFDESFDTTDPTSGEQSPSAWIEEGTHYLVVHQHKYIEDSDTFVAELLVRESTYHVEGDTVSFIVSGQKQPFRGAAEKNRAEIKRYVAVALGVDPDGVTTRVVKGTCTEEGRKSVQGRIVKCVAFKNKAGNYTHKKWSVPSEAELARLGF